MKTGIYKITNIVNNKFYIGSSVNVRKRIVDHIRRLRSDTHGNPHLQKAWNKYKEEKFSFNVLLYCDKDSLIFYENRAIEIFNTLNSDKGYNCIPAKDTHLTGSNYEKIKYQRAETQKKIMQSVKARQRISQANKGRILSEKTRTRMSRARKGKKRPKEHTAGMLASNIGRIPSQKTKKLWSIQRKGKMTGAESPRAKATIMNGKLYPTVTAAIEALGISKTTYYRKLKGGIHGTQEGKWQKIRVLAVLLLQNKGLRE